MSFYRSIPVIVALAGFTVQTAYADEGDSKLVGPMSQPIKVENPRALESAKGQSLADRGLIDGIVGPAMNAPVAERSDAAAGKKDNSKSKKSR